MAKMAEKEEKADQPVAKNEKALGNLVRKLFCARHALFEEICKKVIKALPEPRAHIQQPIIPFHAELMSELAVALTNPDKSDKECSAAVDVFEAILRLSSVTHHLFLTKYFHDMMSFALIGLFCVTTLQLQRRLLSALLTLLQAGGPEVQAHIHSTAYVLASIASDSNEHLACVDGPYVSELVRRTFETLKVVHKDSFTRIILRLLRYPGTKAQSWAIGFLVQNWDNITELWTKDSSSSKLSVFHPDFLASIATVARTGYPELSFHVIDVIECIISRAPPDAKPEQIGAKLPHEIATNVAYILCELLISEDKQVVSKAIEYLRKLTFGAQKSAVVSAVNRLAKSVRPGKGLTKYMVILSDSEIASQIIMSVHPHWISVMGRNIMSPELRRHVGQTLFYVLTHFEACFFAPIMAGVGDNDPDTVRRGIVATVSFLQDYIHPSSLFLPELLLAALSRQSTLGLSVLLSECIYLARSVRLAFMSAGVCEHEFEEMVKLCHSWEGAIVQFLRSKPESSNISPILKALLCHCLAEIRGLPMKIGNTSASRAAVWIPLVVSWVVSSKTAAMNSDEEASAWSDYDKVYSMSDSVAGSDQSQYHMGEMLKVIEENGPWRSVRASVIRLVAAVVKQGGASELPTRGVMSQLSPILWDLLLDQSYPVMQDAAFLFVISAEELPIAVKNLMYSDFLSESAVVRRSALEKYSNLWADRNRLGRYYRALFEPKLPPANFRPTTIGTSLTEVPPTSLLEPPIFASVSAVVPEEVFSNTDAENEQAAEGASHSGSSIFAANRSSQPKHRKKTRYRGSFDFPVILTSPVFLLIEACKDNSSLYLDMKRELLAIIADDPQLALQIILTQLGHQGLPNQLELLTRIQQLQRHILQLPHHYCYIIFNNVLGLLLSVKSDAVEVAEVLTIHILSVVYDLVDRIAGFEIGDLRQARGEVLLPRSMRRLKGSLFASPGKPQMELSSNCSVLGPMRTLLVKRLAETYPNQSLVLAETVADSLAPLLIQTRSAALDEGNIGAGSFASKTWLDTIQSILTKIPSNAGSVFVPYFASVLQSVLNFDGNDVEVVFNVMAVFLDLARHFEQFFANSGYSYVIPALSSLFERQYFGSNDVVEAVLYTWRQFCMLHRENLWLQVSISLSQLGVDSRFLYALFQSIEDTRVSRIGQKIEELCATSIDVANLEPLRVDAIYKMAAVVVAYSPASRLSLALMEMVRHSIPGNLVQRKGGPESLHAGAIKALLSIFTEIDFSAGGAKMQTHTIPAENIEAVVVLATQFLRFGGTLNDSHFSMLESCVKHILLSGATVWMRRVVIVFDYFMYGLSRLSSDQFSLRITPLLPALSSIVHEQPHTGVAVGILTLLRTLYHSNPTIDFAHCFAKNLVETVLSDCRYLHVPQEVRASVLGLVADTLVVGQTSLMLPHITRPSDYRDMIRGIVFPLARRLGPVNIGQLPQRRPTKQQWSALLNVAMSGLRVGDALPIALATIKVLSVRAHTSLTWQWPEVAIVLSQMVSGMFMESKQPSSKEGTPRESLPVDDVLDFLEFLGEARSGPYLYLRPIAKRELVRLRNGVFPRLTERAIAVYDLYVNPRPSPATQSALLQLIDEESSTLGVDT